MKSARDRAVEVAHRLIGSGFSIGMFTRLLEDSGDAGKQAREAVHVLTQAFKADRRACAAEKAPS